MRLTPMMRFMIEKVRENLSQSLPLRLTTQ